MRIISLRSYSSGYAGFIEETDSYVYFNFRRKGKLKRLLKYNKSNYTDYGHFVGGITKFFPYSFFLKKPVPLESCTIEELDRISKQISDR